MSIELVDVFGDDLMVVNSARVSFAKRSTEFVEQDEKLIRYLAKHNHISPFFHPQIQFRIKMPIFVAREWYRHQIGFARNEVSRRYVDSEPECFVPNAEDIRERDKNKKQGSKSTPVANAEYVHEVLSEATHNAMDSYDTLLKNGVAPEVARMILPQSMYTEFIETGSLAAYARLYKLRTSPEAQKEIRDFADKISIFLSEKFPISWQALSSSE